MNQIKNNWSVYRSMDWFVYNAVDTVGQEFLSR